MGGARAPWTACPGGIRVLARATPKAAVDAIEGVIDLGDGRVALKVRVRAAPEDGKANEALRRLLAKALGAAPSMVRLASGSTSRVKTFEVDGDSASLGARLDAIRAEAG